ncbi:MAG: glutathione S-transferase family protein [Myxococcota bacterium]|nr:glutathione S-transferase family protein [Myxococcota bacterium]
MALTLYMHPASITSRPVRLFIAEKRIDVVERVIDIVTGEHYKDEYLAINPNRQVPTLEDGAFRLTECSTILKYLAARFDAPEYPRALEARAKVDEAMDWFNCQLYRDFAYEFIYPQVFPHLRRPTETDQHLTIMRGKEKASFWFEVLERHLLGPRDFVANNQLSIADYLGGCIVAAGDMIGCTLEAYPNVRRWMGRIKGLESWPRVSDVMCRFAEQLQGTKFVTL